MMLSPTNTFKVIFSDIILIHLYASAYVKLYIVAVCGIMEEEAMPPSASTERPGVTLLKSWLNKNMKVLMSDGRVLVGIFLCTDRWAAAALQCELMVTM